MISCEEVKMEEVVHLEQLEEEHAVGMTVTLFIKKLWNMVNDRGAEDIISWSSTGDSFIIHDQLQLTTKLLPHYFKHNNMASFVRQLNFYNFRKVPNAKNQIQFAHSCFLKDVPQILVFIKRKHSLTPKQNSSTNVNEQQMNNLLNDLTEMKKKHSQINEEMLLLKQDSLALWNELNSLRMKYANQSSVINKLIHFLITYIHKHQTSFSKQNIRVSRNVNQNNLESVPTLLELDFINPKESPKKSKTEPYSVLQPGSSKTITYSLKIPDSHLESNGKTVLSRDSTLPKKSTQSLKQILSMNESRHQTGKDPIKNSQGGVITYSVKLPGNQSRKIAQSDIQNSLLEILEENEKMSVENSLEEMLIEIQTDDVELIDRGNNHPIVQSPPVEESSGVDTNSKKINTFVIPETNYIVEYPDQSEVNFTNETGEVNCQNSKSTPVRTLGKKRSYVNVSKSCNNPSNNFVPETSCSNPTRLPDKKKTFLYCDSQCLPKKSKKSSTKKLYIQSLEIPVNQSKELVQPEVQKSLLDIFEENGTLSTEIPLENLFSDISEENVIPDPAITKQINPTVNQVQETYPIIESPPEMNSNNSSLAVPQSNITEIYDNDITGFSDIDLEPIIESPTDETVASLNLPNDLTKYSILENPKQNLSLYLDNTQEELNMLQEILNNLNSKDFGSNINLNSSFEAICSTEESKENEIDNINKSPSDIDVIESSNDCNLAPTTNVSVDEFFNTEFMNSNG